MHRVHFRFVALFLVVVASACQVQEPGRTEMSTEIQNRLAKYTPFVLTGDLQRLSENERKMIPLLIEAAQQMHTLFWLQAYGDKSELLTRVTDPDTRRFIEINYGPWDRLAGDEPFLPGQGPKPAGANLYPTDMSKDEFEQAAAVSEDAARRLKSLYTLIRRDADGKLTAMPYREAFAPQLKTASEKLKGAAALAEDAGLKDYLEKRAQALITDDYQASDMAWMDMKQNTLDIVIGPIETYEDQLFGYKAAYEAFVLIKDQEWSQRLSKYIGLLPALQKELPVPPEYKQEMPGGGSDLNAYDAVYFAGDCNAGSKTIAINLPNDEEVQLKKGSRRLQLKNAMRAKFDKILIPIAGELVAEDQQGSISFDAFFSNVMFHEVAHGLGISQTINGRGPVRQALKEKYSPLEEAKADVLGLFMVTKLMDWNELPQAERNSHFVTYMASIFRAVRFGASSAHGVANLIQFNFFTEKGAFVRDAQTGRYRVDFEKMPDSVSAFVNQVLGLQGDGDYAGAAAMADEKGGMGTQLGADLQRLAKAGIPVDVVFEQGLAALGLAH